MQQAGMSGREIAGKLGWSDSRVSRLMAGTRGGTEADVSAFLAICGVTGKERERLLKLCKDQYIRSWFQQHGAHLPVQLTTLIDHETKAVSIAEYQSTLVPGLLQTGTYARAVITASGAVPDDEVEDRVSANIARKSIFTRQHPPKFTFFIHEFVLRLPVGGAGVMSEQLHELLRMSVRPNVILRVLPAAIGAHPGCAGSFKLMEFAEFKPVAYLDSETSSLFLELPDEIAAYRRILKSLDEIALDEGQSREVIGNVAVELYESGES
jgi:transcriptional regulator with XRE-family HTH domain